MSGRVWVSGAGGFAGRATMARLRQAGFEAMGVDLGECDLADLAQAQAQLARARPDFVVHLAAKASPGSRGASDFDEQYAGTVVPARNVALALPETVRLAVFVGSIEEYGRNDAPFSEAQRPAPISAYGWAKVAAHEAMRLICRERGRAFVWLRPALLYGPGMSTERFLGAVAQAAATGAALDLTPCEQTRDFLHVDDFAERIVRVLREPARAAAGEVFNVTSEGRRRLLDVLADVEALGYSPRSMRVGARRYREGEIMEFHNSGAKFRAAFGDAPAIPFLEGLRATIESFVEPRKKS